MGVKFGHFLGKTKGCKINVRAIANGLYQLTEPVLRPIRNVLPNLGGIDVSPVILLLGIFFIENVIVRYIYPAVF